jgi:hypothetical protein
MGGVPAGGTTFLQQLRRRHGSHYDFSECVLSWHAAFGRGLDGYFTWREPSLSPAFALIVAPMFPFTHNVEFDLARHRSAFSVSTLVLHRVLRPGVMLDLGNVTFTLNESSEPADKPTARLDKSSSLAHHSSLQRVEWLGSVGDAMERVSRFLY